MKTKKTSTHPKTVTAIVSKKISDSTDTNRSEVKKENSPLQPDEFLELFAPFSKLYNVSTISQKIERLNTIFQKPHCRNIDLMFLRNSYEDYYKISIPEAEFLVGCGIYLDASIKHGVICKAVEQLTYQYGNEFVEMQNGRSKLNKYMQKMSELQRDSRKTTRIQLMNTREFFDNGSSEWNGSKITEKQEVLRNLYKVEGLKPSLILFYHIYCYRANNKYNQGYEHVLHEAPYSCFSLCFGESEFLLPDPKMFYNQSANRVRLIELDWERYCKKNQ